jgi:dipeptidyl-peptidase-4
MSASERRLFTHADFDRVARALPWVMAAKVRNAQVGAHWIGGGIGAGDRFWYRRGTKEGGRFVLVEAATGVSRPAFDHERLARALAAATGTEVSADRLGFDGFDLSADGSAITFEVAEASWRFDLHSGDLTPGLPPPGEGERPSPDGRLLAFLKGPDIWLRDRASGRERPLTVDGEVHWAYGKSPDSNLTAITWRRAGVSPPPVLLWSPDSRRILTHRLDERRVAPLHLHQSVPDDGGVRPVLHEIRAPLPGDAELALVRHLSIDVETGAQTWANAGPFVVGNGSPIERGRVWWDEEGRMAYLLDTGRAEKWIRLCQFDSATGEVRVLREERAPTFVEPHLDPMARPNIRVLPGAKEFIWFSQTDGWAHLYLCDAWNGQVINRITEGRWVVRDILHVDAAARTILFTAGGLTPGRDPYLRQVCRASLDGGPVTVLTDEPCDHQVATAQPMGLIHVPLNTHRRRPLGVSTSGRYFVETQTHLDRIPVSLLRDARDGRVIAKLEEAETGDAMGPDWRWPEPITVKAADGETDLHGAIWLPSDFDPAKRYPVLDLIYPGPQRIQTPKQSFSSDPFGIGAFALPRAFAELGMIVVNIDGRGTPLRSKAFHDHYYGRMETAGGLEDHIDGLRQLAATRPYMDLDRVGITGHSGGGFASTRAIFAYPDFFKVAVSSSGNHDQRGYLQQWGEKYQGLMSEGASYAAQVNASLAHRLEGKLLLAYADMDDNVPPALTLQVADALIRANKDFELLVMPNHNHLTIYRDGYFFRKVFEFFLRHLVGVEVERGYRLPGLDAPWVKR